MATKTKTIPAAATQTQQQAQQPVQAAQTQATTATPKAVNGIAFAKPKAERRKSDRPFCEHVTTKRNADGKTFTQTRCQLRVLEGRTLCVNHVPAEEKLTAEEATAMLTLVGGLDEAQQIRLLTRSIGWFKVKQLVSGKPEGDLVLNELVG